MIVEWRGNDNSPNDDFLSPISLREILSCFPFSSISFLSFSPSLFQRKLREKEKTEGMMILRTLLVITVHTDGTETKRKNTEITEEERKREGNKNQKGETSLLKKKTQLLSTQ